MRGLIGWEYMFMLEIIVYRDGISNFLGAQESIPPAFVATAGILEQSIEARN
jgi:hypothetical protein